VNEPDDFNHIGFGQFVGTVPFAPAVRAVSDPVGLILCFGCPPEVIEIIVELVPVAVGRFHPGRTRTDEGFQDESVDRAVMPLTVSPKLNLQIPAASRHRLETDPLPTRFVSEGRTATVIDPLQARPHRTVVTHPISREVWYSAKTNRRLGFSHDVPSRNRGCFVVRAGGR